MKKIFICLLFLTLLASCNNNENKNNHKDNIEKPGKTIIGNCNYYNYLNNYNKNNLSDNYVIESEFFKNMENHKTSLITDNYWNNFKVLDTVKCNNKCDDLNLNKVYESLIALKVQKSRSLNSEFVRINNKIINRIKEVLQDKFDQSIDNWINLKDENIAFPSLQRQNFYDIKELPVTATKIEKMRYVLGLPVKIGGIVYNNSNPNASLQYDYIIKHSYRGEGIGLINSAAVFENEREYSYRGFIMPLRGYRRDVSNVETLQFGVSSLDVEELKAPAGSKGWKDQRQKCAVEPNVTLYGKSIAQRNIPIVCGISGSTNLTLTTLFAYNVDLSERELLLYLLEAWSILSGDTGHTLQEVISTAKLVTIYYNALLKQTDPDFSSMIHIFPKNTLHNLTNITKNIRPLADVHLQTDRKKWESIESYIFSFDPTSVTIPKKRLVIAADYGKDKKYSDLSEKEKQERRDFEYYFNQYDSLNSNSAEFGAYYDSFFNHIDSFAFKKARFEAQETFKKYFKRSCSN